MKQHLLFLFIIFSLILIATLYASFSPNLLQATDPILGFKHEFGFYEYCTTFSNTRTCTKYAKQCKIDGSESDLSLCQGFVLGKYIQLIALGFGAAEWAGYLIENYSMIGCCLTIFCTIKLKSGVGNRHCGSTYTAEKQLYLLLWRDVR